MKSINEKLSQKGKVVIVTGGYRGIGLAIAQNFAQAGAALAICGRNTKAVRLPPKSSVPKALTASSIPPTSPTAPTSTASSPTSPATSARLTSLSTTQVLPIILPPRK